MILNRLFDPLWLDADVLLRGGAAVLQNNTGKAQKMLHCFCGQSFPKMLFTFIDICCIVKGNRVGTSREVLSVMGSCVTDEGPCPRWGIRTRCAIMDSPPL